MNNQNQICILILLFWLNGVLEICSDVTYELTYVTNFYIRMVLLHILGSLPPSQYLALYAKVRILFESQTPDS
jgi:hypothetical protein